MGLSMPWRMGDEIKSRRAPRNPWQALDRYVNSEVNKKRTKMKKEKKELNCAECFNNLSSMQGEAWHSEYYTYCRCEVMVFDFFLEKYLGTFSSVLP